MSSRAKVFTVILLFILAGGFIYLQSLAHRLNVQNTRSADEAARARLAEETLQSQHGPEQTVTLYIPSADQGVLIQETRRMNLAASETDRIRQIFLALVERSATGPARPLSPAPNLRAAFLTSDGTAYLDLDGTSVSSFEPGINSETLAVKSIVNSICTNIPAVKRVRILIQGQEVDTLNGHVDLTQALMPDLNPNSSGP
jgi:spore germination protein GerM